MDENMPPVTALPLVGRVCRRPNSADRRSTALGCRLLSAAEDRGTVLDQLPPPADPALTVAGLHGAERQGVGDELGAVEHQACS